MTDTIRNCPSGFVENYEVGVNRRDRFIVLGFNKMSAHYIGFISDTVERSSYVNRMDMGSNESESVHNRPITVLQETVANILPVNVIAPISGVNNILLQDIVSKFCRDTDMNVNVPISNVALQVMVTDDVLVDVIDDVLLQCENCLRISTSLLSLDVQQLTCTYTDRKMKLLIDSKGACLTQCLCCDCRFYLNAQCTFVSKSKWVHGWPAAIACLLTRPQHGSIQGAVWKMFPLTHRESWSKLALSTKFDTSQCCEFIDFGVAILQYAQRKSATESDFVKLMDETCMPCVKCPAGCCQYVEKCDPLPLNRFLAWKFGISIFGGDCKLLSGARTDWPMSSVLLGKFPVTPGMTVTENGLCMLLCDFHGGNLRKAIVHVPLHPVLEDLGSQMLDIDAAAYLSPNTIHEGRMGRWTNSSHVLNAIGSHAGISPSSIGQHVDNVCQGADFRLGTATFLAANHREDVRRTIEAQYMEMAEGRRLLEKDL